MHAVFAIAGSEQAGGREVSGWDCGVQAVEGPAAARYTVDLSRGRVQEAVGA